jgi:hypothetical protein
MHRHRTAPLHEKVGVSRETVRAARIRVRRDRLSEMAAVGQCRGNTSSPITACRLALSVVTTTAASVCSKR